MIKNNTQWKALTNLKSGQSLFFLCWILYCSAYFGRLNYSAAMTEMIANNILSKEFAGGISTAFFLFYGIGQLINGFLGDKISPFRMIFMGVFFSGIANLAMYGVTYLLPSNPSVAILFMAIIWGMNGYAQSLIWSPIIRIFSNILPEEQRIKACIHVASTVPVGTLGCYLMATVCMAFLGWRTVFLFPGIFLVSISLFWLFKTRPIQKEVAIFSYETASVAPPKESNRGFGKLLWISGVLFMLLPVALLGILKDGVTAWVPTYLTEIFKTVPAFSVFLTTILPITNLTGAYASQFVQEKWLHDELKTSAFFFLLATIATIGLYFLGSVHILLAILCFCIITSCMIAISTMLISLVPMRFGKMGKSSSVTGLLNSGAYGGSAFSTYAIGMLSASFGWSFTIFLWVALGVVGIASCLLLAAPWRKFTNSEK